MVAKRKIIISFIVLIVFALLFIRYSYRAPKRHYSDFRVYYATAERFADKEDIYARPDESITPYKYSPMFAMLVSPLSKFSQKTASLIFFTLNFISVILILFFSEKLIAGDNVSFRDRVIMYGGGLLCSFRFVLHAMDAGQVGILVLALVVIGLYLIERKKTIGGSFCVGLSIMVKYMPVIFLPYFALRKRMKVVLFVVAFIGLFCVLPAIFVGFEKEVEYVKNWLPFISDTSFDSLSIYDYKNQSLFALVLRFFTKVTPYNVSIANLSFNQGMITALFLGGISYAFIVIPKKESRFEKALDYSSLFALLVLLNPNAWMHNFVVLLFIYMTLFYHLIKTNFKDKVTLILVIISFALTTLSAELFVGDALEELLERFSSVGIGTLLLLFILLKLKWKPRGVFYE